MCRDRLGRRSGGGSGVPRGRTVGVVTVNAGPGRLGSGERTLAQASILDLQLTRLAADVFTRAAALTSTVK